MKFGSKAKIGKLAFLGVVFSLLIFTFSLTTCSNPAGDEESGEMGTFTINLGGNGRAAYPPDIPAGNNPGGLTANDLTFSVRFLQGSTPKGTFTSNPGTTTLSGKIPIGDYSVEVEVFLNLDNSLLALGGLTGGGTITIVAGNNDIHVTLNRSITVGPSTITLMPGWTQAFTAAVYGVSTTPTIAWDVTGGNGLSSMAGSTLTSTLTVDGGETDGTLTVTAKYTDANGIDRIEIATVTVSTTMPPLGGTLDITGCCALDTTLLINHDLWVNATLTIDDTLVTGGFGTRTIQWQRNGADIPSATGTSYTIVEADKGATIRATVQYSSSTGIVISGTHGPIQDLTGIYNATQLADINTPSAYLKNYIQTRDITLPSTNWAKIGPSTGADVFSGSYDGNNKTITNLTIITPATDYQGLFGFVSGTVKNLNLANVTITGTGRNYIGGIAGNCLNGGLIDNCSVQGSIIGTNTVGGVVGLNNNNGCYVQNCSFTGTVDGSQYVGGIVGNNNNGGAVLDCHVSATVNATANVGGIVGYNYGSSSLVQGCYVTSGTITGTGNDVGGVVGQNYAGTVEKCYSGADVEGVQNVGGVAGENITGGKLLNCYATGDVTGTGSSSSIGGVVGATNYGVLVQYCYATGSVSGQNLIGGILGSHSSGGVNSVNNCVALNSSLISASSIGRVAGANSWGVFNNNYARDPMTTTPPITPADDPSDYNGGNVASADWYNASWWSSPSPGTGWYGTGWDFSTVWFPPNGTSILPTLRGVGGTQTPGVTP